MDVLRVLVMVVAMAVTASRSSAIPQSDEHKSRVVDHVSMSICQHFMSMQQLSVVDSDFLECF